MTKSYSYRMDPKDHDSAQAILNDLGLDTTTAIKIFFKQITQRQGLPFSISKHNPEISPEMEREIAESVAEYRSGDYKSFDNVEDLLKDLKN